MVKSLKVRKHVDIVQLGPDRLRVGPWRGDPNVAQVAPVIGRPAAPDTVDRCIALLREQGYRSVLTAALSAGEQVPFLDAGFTVHERLHLLRHPLDRVPGDAGHRLRRARWFDVPRVLEVDALAFDPFWRFDRAGITDARAATPSSRFRVADHDGVVGYAITGRAGPVGYLQRLAVHPARQREGVGTALVADAIRWVRARGATSLLVNTQEINATALALYEHLGFVREERGLAVLELDLPGEPA